MKSAKQLAKSSEFTRSTKTALKCLCTDLHRRAGCGQGSETDLYRWRKPLPWRNSPAQPSRLSSTPLPRTFRNIFMGHHQWWTINWYFSKYIQNGKLCQISSESSGRVGEGQETWNLCGHLFMTYFYRAGGEACPVAPHPHIHYCKFVHLIIAMVILNIFTNAAWCKYNRFHWQVRIHCNSKIFI